MISKVTDDGTDDIETVTYRYNLQNRLQRVITDSDPSINTNTLSVVDYAYNASGIRTSKYSFSVAQDVLDTVNEQTNATDKVTIVYLVDPANHTGYAQVLEELTFNKAEPNLAIDTPDSVTTYTIGGDVIAQTVNGTTQYLLYDGHGSTRQLARPDTSVIDSYSYDAYGVMLSSGSGAAAASSAATSLLYAGEQYDSHAEQYYLRDRYYDSLNGRFNQADRYSGNINDPQSLHKYLYCYANPVNAFDPSGLSHTLSENLSVMSLTSI